jgi:8-oxo-dGTP pyrophosphatase MutT (NUDIX family)
MLKRINVGRSVRRALDKQLNKKEHLRPTAVAIILDYKGRMLMVHSRSSDTWGPVKGGFQRRDKHDLERALFREIKEEIGLLPTDFCNHRYIGSVKNRGFARKRRSQDFAVGKHFHCMVLQLNRSVRCITITDPSLSELMWVGSKQRLLKLAMMESRRTIWAAIAMQLNLPWARC